MNALLMLRRCGQHQGEGDEPHARELEPVQSHDRETVFGGPENLPPSDLGYFPDLIPESP